MGHPGASSRTVSLRAPSQSGAQRFASRSISARAAIRVSLSRSPLGLTQIEYDRRYHNQDGDQGMGREGQQ